MEIYLSEDVNAIKVAIKWETVRIASSNTINVLVLMVEIHN